MSVLATSNEASGRSNNNASRPWGLKWRSSVWFVTLVVGFGVATDLFAYAVIIPVVPFRLKSLGYTDASARTGYLLFAYSGGLAVSTPPIAWFSERYKMRRTPLLLGLIALIGSQVMFMLAPYYWLMALARIIQGVSSTCVWTVGLALLCDTIPESRVGQQLGLAMTGLSAGVVIAPPVGGALFQRLGFHAPFIFSIGIAVLDLIGRLFVIERKHAILWGVDPAFEASVVDPEQKDEKDAIEKPPASLPLTATLFVASDVPVPGAKYEDLVVEPQPPLNQTLSPTKATVPHSLNALGDSGSQITVVDHKELREFGVSPQPSFATTLRDPSMTDQAGYKQKDEEKTDAALHADPELPAQANTNDAQLTSMQVLYALCHSSRALAALANTLIFGICHSAQEPTLPLRLQNPYGLTALKVGLIYVAASVPTLLSGPIAGWLTDRKGPGIVTIMSLLMAIPWLITMAVHGPLVLFVVAMVVSNFFIAAVVAPLTAELAAVARLLPGVGYSHVYGAFNLAYGIGSALGPLVGGQLYDHLRHGWTAVVGLAAGIILAAGFIAFLYAGETPVAKKIFRLLRSREDTTSAVTTEATRG